MLFNLLLAASGPDGNGAANIANNSLAIARELDIALQTTWKTTLTGPLYTAICNIGAGILAFGAFYGLASVLRREMHKNSVTPFISAEKIVVAMVLVLLLGTPVSRGKGLSELSFFAHRQFQNVGNSLLSNISKDIQSDINQQAQTKTNLESIIPQKIQACWEIDDKEKRDFCLQRLDDSIKGETQQYAQQGWASQLYERWHKEINDGLSAEKQDEWDPIGSLTNGAASIVGGIGQGVAYSIIQSVLITFGTAFLYVINQAALISFEVLPIFIGAAPFSEDFQSIKVSVGGICALEGAGILYKIIVAQVSLTVLNSPPNDPLLTPLMLAVVAIAMSLALVAGGGVGLISIFSSVSGRMMR
jgi:hypothetical protein